MLYIPSGPYFSILQKFKAFRKAYYKIDNVKVAVCNKQTIAGIPFNQRCKYSPLCKVVMIKGYDNRDLNGVAK